MLHSKRPRLLDGSKINDDNLAVANDDLTTADKLSIDVSQSSSASSTRKI
jgi:hypothetical protein